MTAARIHLVVAALMGAAGVALLAAGSHGQGTNAITAGQVLLFHASMVIGATAARKSGLLNAAVGRVALSVLIVGVVIFAADLTTRALASEKLFAMAAPLGGILTISGWLILAASALIRPRN